MILSTSPELNPSSNSCAMFRRNSSSSSMRCLPLLSRARRAPILRHSLAAGQSSAALVSSRNGEAAGQTLESLRPFRGRARLGTEDPHLTVLHPDCLVGVEERL